MNTSDSILETENRSQLILDEANKLFCEFGYSGTRMTDIAEAIGVTKPIVYRYYKSKEELFETWVNSVLNHRREIVKAKIDDTSLSVKEITKQILDATLSGLDSPLLIAPWRIALIESDSFPQITRLVCSKFKDPLMKAVEAMFERALKTSEVQGETAKVLAQLFCAPIGAVAAMIATFGLDVYPVSNAKALFEAHHKSFWIAWGK